MTPRLIAHVRRHYAGLLALIVALSGTAYAASLPRNSVGTQQLKRNAVTSAKVQNRSLKRKDFAPRQLPAGPRGPEGPSGATGPRGATGATGEQGPAGPATAAAAGDLTGSYPAPTIGAGKVTDSKLASHASDNAGRAVGTDHIKFDAINGQHVLDGSIMGADIQSHGSNSLLRAISGSHIQEDSISSSHVQAGSIGPTDMGVKPLVKARISAPGSLDSSTSGGLVSFDAEDFDTADMHSPAEGWKAVAPIAGIYRASAYLAFDPEAASAADGSRFLSLFSAHPVGVGTSFTTEARDLAAPVPDLFTPLYVSTLINLDAGDWIQVDPFQSSGETLQYDEAEVELEWLGPAS